VKEGAGAFVCGEETALMASIEGERGMPRPRPPFPANRGLWGKPSNINNVETWANVPAIIRNGGAWYAAIGTEKSKGTKVFALTGKVKNTGLIEVPMGITIREVVFELGGGIINDKKFKAVQIGGPPAAVSPENTSTFLDYESLTARGPSWGRAGLSSWVEETCMVDVAILPGIHQRESCGKCVPLQRGTKQMLHLLEKITAGEGTMEDLRPWRTRPHGEGHVPLRTRSDRAESGAHHTALLPARVRGAHSGQEMPCLGLY
jgi:NADH:ubiquinone oxidoreductase subunit F (NADH-binding)